MSIELTDTKRYELEKDNVISLLLSAARSQTPMTPEDLSFTLNIDLPTVDRLLTAFRNDQIIK